MLRDGVEAMRIANARVGRIISGLFLLALPFASGMALAAQQDIPGGTRECQTVRTCNFSRYASVRGCLSSYTCRTCRLVTSRCNLGGYRTCQKMVCAWGG